MTKNPSNLANLRWIMADMMMLRQSSESLRSHIEAGDWDRADRELQYLVGAWQRARLRGSESVEIAAFFDDLRMRLITDHDVNQALGPSQLAWIVAGVCLVATQFTA